MKYFEKWDKNHTEKVHLQYCKYYLGVNNNASNVGRRAELVRFPLKNPYWQNDTFK